MQEIISERLRDFRALNNLTQREVAEIINVKRSTYCYYESGRIFVPITNLYKLAVFYHTSMDYLTGLTDNSTPYRQ